MICKVVRPGQLKASPESQIGGSTQFPGKGGMQIEIVLIVSKHVILSVNDPVPDPCGGPCQVQAQKNIVKVFGMILTHNCIGGQ